MIGGGLAAVVIIAAVLAVILTASPSGSLAEPARQPIGISGTVLPGFTDPANDPAIGQPIPQLSGIGLDGEPLSIGPGDGPMAIVILAHWCHVCQSEVPILVDHLAATEMPAGVELVALATSIDPARPNYPPSSWLAQEGWSAPTMIDDASSRGLTALGMNSFPSFVFVDGDGRVAYRTSGALGAQAFGQIVEQLAP
jgi:hypothetical protein